MDENTPKTSPVFKRPKPEEGTMWFGDCLKALTAITPSPRVRRLEWPDDGTYVTLKDEKLMIYRPDDKRLHPLTVSTGDIQGQDWIIIGEARS